MADIRIPIAFQQRGAKDTADAISNIEAEVQRLGRSFDRTSSEAVSAAAEVGRQYGVVADRIDGATEAQLRLNRAIEAQPKSGNNTNSLNTLSTAGGVSGQIASGLGGGELANAAGFIGDVAGAFSTANPLIIAGAVGIGVLSVAMQEYNRELEESRTIVQGFASGLAAAFQAGTTEAINALRRQEEVRIAIATATRDALIEASTDAQSAVAAFAQANTITSDLGTQFAATLAAIFNGADSVEVIEDTRLNITAYNEAIADQNSDLAIGEARLRAFDLVLQDGTTAANDAAAAEEEYAAVLERKAEIARQIAADEEAAARAAQAAAEARRQADLSRRQSELENAAAAKARFDDFASATAASQSKVATALAAYQESLNAVPAAVARIENDLSEKRADITRAGEDKRVDILLQAQREVEKIERSFTRSFAQAVGERDALAAKQAETARKDELADETKSRSDALNALRRDLQRQNEATGKAAQRAIALEIERGNKEVSARRLAYSQTLTDLSNAKRAELNIHQQYLNATLQATAAWGKAVGYEWNRALANLSAATGAGGKGSGWAPSTQQVQQQINRSIDYVFGNRLGAL